MRYLNLQECVKDLQQHKMLEVVDAPVSNNLELAAIQRRAFAKGSPALLFTNVENCKFPMLANLFGSKERVNFIFRSTLRTVEKLFRLKLDPMEALKKPWQYLGIPKAAYTALPRTVKNGPILEHTTTISQLPQLVSWPRDGGAFITLPQVYTEDPSRKGFAHSNLGMYRIQLSGNEYTDDEVGLHYQIHRGIGPHHMYALKMGKPLAVNIFIGGAPAMTLAAIMPLPEGMPEIAFAGLLGGRRMDMIAAQHAGISSGLPILAQADFCICGTIAPYTKPEGPFGDHLGYYSLKHDFPVLKVEKVFHRKNAIWPFTSVGRPPQEDTMFGDFIHELTAELVPTVFSGVHEVHAVDVAGVHPLLLAIGSERYVPFAEERQAQELITCGLSLLGSTQTSLAKYIFMAAKEDDASLSTHDLAGFFQHMLSRFDPTRDLHFVTRTTMDTLDYTGISLNQGSKLIFTATGAPKRTLCQEIPDLPSSIADHCGAIRYFAPGILIAQTQKHTCKRDEQDPQLFLLAEKLEHSTLDTVAMIVLVDNAEFTAQSWANFLWVTFTRSDPATDIYGCHAFTHCKHWGAKGPLIIDARLKSFHAPALEEDPAIEKKIEAMATTGGPLHNII